MNGRKKILVVDNNPLMLHLMQQFLEKKHHQVITAENGLVALTILKRYEPEFVFIDLVMPHINGELLCRAIRSDVRFQNTRLIIVSAVAAEKNVDFKAFGADACIVKGPFEKVAGHVERIMAAFNKEGFSSSDIIGIEDIYQRDATRELLNVNQHLEKVLDYVSDGIVEIDWENNILFANHAAVVFLNCAREQLLARNLTRFFDDGDRRIIDRALSSANRTPLQQGCEEPFYRNGRYIVADCFSVSGQGHPTRIVILKDITLKREKEMMFRAEMETAETAYRKFVPHTFLNLLQKKDIVTVEFGDHIEKYLTIMFSDIRGFSSLSERMTPEENFNFLNSYLKRIGPVIRDHGGFIDKFIGDGLMAIFPADVQTAVDAAVAIRLALLEYNRHRKTTGYPPIEIGIGIHAGMCIIGTIGDDERMEGTVISDTVNTASRIEGLTKVYGASIIVSEKALFSLADPNRYHYRYLGNVKVRGKQSHMGLFEVFDADPPAVFNKKIETRSTYDLGIFHHAAGRFDEAMICFKSIVAENPEDGASACMYQRAVKCLREDLSPDWMDVRA